MCYPLHISHCCLYEVCVRYVGRSGIPASDTSLTPTNAFNSTYYLHNHMIDDDEEVDGGNSNDESGGDASITTTSQEDDNSIGYMSTSLYI